MDLWKMQPNGANAQRISYFNGYLGLTGIKAVTGYTSPKYSLVGGIAIDPNNPKVIYASVMNSELGDKWNLWKVQLNN
jgi:hypothetical protein